MNAQTIDIPAELMALPQWVDWRRERNTKVPYTAAGRMASSTDPATWTSYTDALRAFKRGGFAGIGFVFTPADPYCGIDFDDCLSADGEVKQWAAPFISSLASYTEVSPSGTGVKIWTRGKLPDGCKHKVLCGDGSVEVYDRGRYFAFTGMRLASAPATIEDRQAELDRLLAELVMLPAPQPAWRPYMARSATDEIRLAVDAVNHLGTGRADDYNLWLAVGFAAHSVSAGGDMLGAFDCFSRLSAKYVEGEPARKWRSFKSSGESQIAKLICWARKDTGWRPARSQCKPAGRVLGVFHV